MPLRGDETREQREAMTTHRTCGLLLHPTSLPSRYGIGDLGDAAYHFVDFLADARQGIWQVLPLGPTGYGDSPYQCFSAFAGNPLLLSPERLFEAGLVGKRELRHAPHFPNDRVDYGAVIEYKKALLLTAYESFKAGERGPLRRAFSTFCREHAYWLEDFALFMAIKEARGGAAWNTWEPELAHRDPSALHHAAAELAREIESIKFAQFLFFADWRKLRKYANSRGLRVLGDAPIFVAFDSADVWSNRAFFKLDSAGNPTVVAGVPPDYFSATGQLWGNPLYDWDRMRETGFTWWIARIRAVLELFDLVRLDHFRGFSACWEVPAGELTAVDGKWVDVPGGEMFDAVGAALGTLPIVAEDLGIITPDVERLRDHFGFPGMRVMQFAFGEVPTSVHLPHNYVRNTVVYTGTHDNDTTVGWYRSAKGPAERRERALCLEYLGADPREVHWAFVRAAYGSIADTAIVPMQDVLGLGAEARMNRPASTGGNWDWRLPPRVVTSKLARRLAEMAEIYGRANLIGARV